ncbi:hypothetical protein VRK_26170 [Vibrio sp. MEBiC08052]|nr:hypothetical protein VRK_26170 [Vibrio sp. MEBiC08052]
MNSNSMRQTRYDCQLLNDKPKTLPIFFGVSAQDTQQA